MVGLFSKPEAMTPIQPVATTQPVVTEPAKSTDKAAQDAERKRILQERAKYNQNANILTGTLGDTTAPSLGKKVLTGQ